MGSPRLSKVCGIALISLGFAASAGAQTIGSLDDLARLSPPQLDALYASGSPAPMPSGKVRGMALRGPGTSLGPARSRASRIAWQGKVFEPGNSQAVNRFFGVRTIRGNLSYGPSWRDGGNALILDYAGTSKVYGNYRDEIRQVAPGIFLGLMYDRTTSPPNLKMYFALDARP